MGKTVENALVAVSGHELADPVFYRLADVPAELEWFANISNQHTQRAYRNDVAGFMVFFGMKTPNQFREVTRAHLLAWRESLEVGGSSLATIRRKLAAIASLFDHLCESNAVTHNPVRGAKRPKADTNEGKIPAIADGQAWALLDAPSSDTLKGKRDRAILAVLFFHGLRREELCKLRVKDLEQRQGVTHLRVHGKGRARAILAGAALIVKACATGLSHRKIRSLPLARPKSDGSRKITSRRSGDFSGGGAGPCRGGVTGGALRGAAPH